MLKERGIHAYLASFLWQYSWTDNREFKHDVYGRQQTAKMNSDFVFIPTNP